MSAYLFAYGFVAMIDAALQRYHFRDSQGQLIETFDQFITTVEAGRWPS